MAATESRNEKIINELLDQFKEHRDAILVMISDLEVIKKKVDSVIPDTMDRRYSRFFEEKVRSVTDFFSTMLDMRKEMTKSLKDEVELRRKIVLKEGAISLDDLIDVRQLAKKVEKFKDYVEKQKENVVEKAQLDTDEAQNIVRIGEVLS
ncbi:MAG: hypothetical protein ACTSX1_09295 [Candidatus Heimdallarchaeaceae archaeon]